PRRSARCIRISLVIMLLSSSSLFVSSWSLFEPSGACGYCDWYVLSRSEKLMGRPFTSAATLAGGERWQDAARAASIVRQNTEERRITGNSIVPGWQGPKGNGLSRRYNGGSAGHDCLTCRAAPLA